MENVVLILFALGTIVLLGLGLVTLFFGISADEESELPFAGKPWLRPVVAACLLGVASGWPAIIPGKFSGWVFAGVFVLSAIYVWRRWRSGQAPNKSFKADGVPPRP